MSEGAADSRFSNRTFMNLVTEVLYVLIAAVIGLLMVPFYIDELGMAVYAVIPLATSVTAYVMIFADSFCSAVNRYFVVALESGDMGDANLTYSTSLRAILRMSAVVMPVMAVIALLTPNIFDITGSSASSVRLLFLFVLWAAIIVACGSCFNNALIAENKLSVINTIRVTYLVVQIAVILLLFFLCEPRLEHIGFAYMLSSVVYLVLSYAVMKRDYPDLRFRRSEYSSERVREIGSLGVWSIVNKVSNLMFLQASLIVANMFLGTVEEGNFSLVVSMVSMVGTGCMAVANIFYPYYYNRYSQGDTDGIVSVAVTGLKFMGILLSFPLAYICIFSEQILTVWVGAEYTFISDVIWVMFFFLTAQSVMTVMDAVPTIMLNVRGIALITLCFGVLNVILSILTCVFTDWGIVGVGAAWAVTMTARSCVLYPWYNAKTLGCGVTSFIRPELMGMGLFLIAVVLLYAFSSIVTVGSSFIWLLITFFPLFIVYVAVMMRCTLNPDDKRFILASMPRSLSNLFGKLL